MPSNRRVKAIFVTVLVAVIFILYFTRDSRQSHSRDFYERTTAALDRKKGKVSDAQLKAETDAELQSILAHVDLESTSKPEMAKSTDQTKLSSLPQVADKKDDGRETVLTGESQSVAGRKMMPKPKEKPKYPTDVAEGEEKAYNGGKIEQAEEPGTAEAKAELNRILKKSPIIIFSKSYCHHSSRAKTLLLDTYSIVPMPYVVELDSLTKPVTNAASYDLGASPPTLGRKLQDVLAENTRRKTVPNILINGKSIGGADDLVKMDEDGELLTKIREMGGRCIQEVEKRGGSRPRNMRRGEECEVVV